MIPVLSTLLSIVVSVLAVSSTDQDLGQALQYRNENIDHTMLPGCPDAGLDTLVCGFMHQLEGSDTSGFWSVLCSKSDGFVSFSDAAQDTTFVKVEKCGEYTFVYEVLNGPCTGLDTVVVRFENPSTTVITNSLDIDLELDAECHSSPATPICDNVVQISGFDPPFLRWNFCATKTCVATTYSTVLGTVIDSCILDSIACDTVNIVSSDMQCSAVTEVTGDNYLDIVNGLFDALSTTCPMPLICYPPPDECIIPVIDTTILYIPVVDGGLWHYFDDSGNLLPLSDTSLLVLNGNNYVFYIEPGADYYGPDDLTFTILELVGMDFVSPTSNVDITLQWVLEYRYDSLMIVDTTYQLSDTCDWQPCGGVIVKSNSDFPGPPDYPCDPIIISFAVTPNDEQHIVFIDCASPGENIEVCPGQVEYFDVPGFYNFGCVSVDGCPYEMYVEVFDNFVLPQINNITTACENDNLSYNVSFDIIGGQGDYILEGVGVFAYGETVSVNGIQSCVDFTISVLDPSSSCTTEVTVVHCCECSPDNSQLEISICDGESFDFLGRSLGSAGTYKDTLLNFQGCDSIITLVLNVHQTNSEELIISRCEGDSYNFYGEQLNTPGVYYEQMVNQYGCDSVIVLSLNFEVDAISMIDLSICDGEEFDFFGQVLQSPGMYSHTLVGTNGCDSIIELSLSITVMTFEVSVSADCSNGEGGTITIQDSGGGRAPYTYSIDNNDFVASTIFTGLNPANYTVFVKDADGCMDEKLVNVPEVGLLSATVEDSYYLCGEFDVAIDLVPALANVGDVDILWNDGSKAPQRIISEPGSYWVQLTTMCEELRQEFVVNRDESSPADKVYIPNVFTPNDDGVNDVFKPYFSTPVASYEMYVYDRWGDVLIHMTSTEEFWDGSFLDQKMDPAVYVWWLRASLTGCDGRTEEVMLKGDVTLLK